MLQFKPKGIGCGIVSSSGKVRLLCCSGLKGVDGLFQPISEDSSLHSRFCGLNVDLTHKPQHRNIQNKVRPRGWEP